MGNRIHNLVYKNLSLKKTISTIYLYAPSSIKLLPGNEAFVFEFSSKMTINEIELCIAAIEKDNLLYEEKNFDHRIEAIDFIGFTVVEQLEELIRQTVQPDRLILLKCRAEKAAQELSEINSRVFQMLQAKIRKGCTSSAFQNQLAEYFNFNNMGLEETSYDNLDILINGIFYQLPMPQPLLVPEPEMFEYQKTPARIVFGLIRQFPFLKDDVFYDIGSGLGQVAMLINFLSGVTTKGVEFEPAFCKYAMDCARLLNLSNVTFINTDARKADYSDGTIFFMFTPFRNKILEDVMLLLRKEAQQRKITIITYGPCTRQVALQNWLHADGWNDDHVYKLCFFTSFKPED